MTRDSMDDLDHTGAADWNSESAGRAQSTSCLDLTAHTDINRLRALLPSYRPAPDYETAVQHKYMQQTTAQPIQARLIYSSQPEIHQPQLHEVSKSCLALILVPEEPAMFQDSHIPRIVIRP